MKKPTISRNDAETIMIALDQVSQTVDVMNIIVGRLKQRLHQALDIQQEPATERRVDQDECPATLKNDQIH